jgi:iron complex outermembrane receptor protein
MTIRNPSLAFAKTISFYFLIAAASSSVWGQENITLEGISVTASRTIQESEALPVSVTTITSEEIEQSTANNVADVLASVPGINTRSLYGSRSTGSTIDLGGFGASAVNNTLILLDGQRLNDIDIAAIDFSSIPLVFIERIEILPNSGSVLYGNGASGGTINIITKSYYNKTGRVAASTSKYAEPGKLELSLAKSSNNFSSILSMEANNSDGYRRNNELKQRNLLSSSKYHINEDSLIYLTVSADAQNINFPGARRVTPDQDADPATFDPLNEIEDNPRGTSTPFDFGTKEGIRLNTGYQVSVSENDEINFGFGFREKNQTGFSHSEFFGDIYTSYLDTDLTTLSLTPYYKKNFSFASIKNTLTLGVDFYLSDYNSKRSTLKETLHTPIHSVDIKQNLNAYYLQNIFYLNENIIATVGGRREEVKTEASDRYDPGAPSNPFSFDAEGIPFKNTQKENSHTVGFKYLINEKLSAYVRNESSTRFGTADEIFELDPNTFTSSLDPLLPQTGETNELGFNYIRNTFDINASYFISHFENEIHYDIDELGFLSQNINLDDTKREGASLSVTSTPFKNLKIGVNTSYTKAEFEEGPYKGNIVPLVPRQQHHLGIQWAPLEHYTLSSTTHYIGRKYFDNDQLNSFKQIDSYEITDLKLAWSKKNISAALTVYNIFDEKSLIDYGAKSTFSPGVYNGYPLSEREAEISLAYTF